MVDTFEVLVCVFTGPMNHKKNCLKALSHVVIPVGIYQTEKEDLPTISREYLVSFYLSRFEKRVRSPSRSKSRNRKPKSPGKRYNRKTKDEYKRSEFKKS